jgi:hypothetical protein
MSFDFNQMAEALGCWYVAYAERDWLCLVWRPTAISGWTIRYRIRYYEPREPSPWSGLDRRSWYEAQAPADEPRDGLVATLRRLVAGLREQWPEPTTCVDEVLVEGDGRALFEAMMGRPWVHTKHSPEAEAWQQAYRAGRLPAQRRQATRRRGRRRRG